MAEYKDYQKAFYEKVWGPIQEVARRIGVDARIIFAQAALESNWGRSELSRNGNNYFGVKAVGDEPYIVRRTREVINGVSTYVQAKFVQYASPLASIEGYGDFIQRNPRYRSFIGATGLDDELAALQRSGYATDPQYANKLRSVINNMPANNGGSSMPNFSEGSGATVPDPFNRVWDSLVTSIPGLAPLRGFGGVAQGANETVQSVTGAFDWIKELFTVDTAVKVISVVVGIALVVIAISVLIKSDVMSAQPA